MNRRTTFSTARWAGLVALGVAFGLLLTSSLQPRALGQTKYENFKCKETTCFDGGCYPGGCCGECLGGLYSPFYMCILDPGYECTPDEGKYGAFECNGSCTGTPGFCACRWAKCQ